MIAGQFQSQITERDIYPSQVRVPGVAAKREAQMRAPTDRAEGVDASRPGRGTSTTGLGPPVPEPGRRGTVEGRCRQFGASGRDVGFPLSLSRRRALTKALWAPVGGPSFLKRTDPLSRIGAVEVVEDICLD